MTQEHDVASPLGEAGERFELLSRLGSGGMGVVYRAFDRERGVQVALKTLRSVDPKHVLRFKTEFRALRDLRHPNLIELGELFEHRNSWFFTMELIEGVDFLDYVRGAVRLAESSTITQALSGTATEVETAISTPPEVSERVAAARGSGVVRSARPQCDQDRLRHCLAGLCFGLAALHDAGKVHRDIKPSNIVVDGDGRTVLLDFGVVAELGEMREFEQGRLVGTVKYMAPEQASGAAVGPPADWYAVGVLMFQALTGKLPFAGDLDSVLLSKRTLRAPNPGALADGIDPDLAQLCERLLERDPDRRAGVDEVLETLALDRSVDDWIWARSTTEGRLFVGRERELGVLAKALTDSRARSVCVLVEGESGVGKSAVLDHFIEQKRAEEPHLIVLRGRCHERERVSYNALDGIIDDLTRFLLGRRTAKVEQLVPDRVAALLKLFPSLRAVAAFADRAPLAFQRGRTSDVRGEAFSALRELLGSLGARRSLLLTIDDVQWADRDSIALLSELVHGVDSPPLCLVATRRMQQGAATPDRVDWLADDFRRIALGPLTSDESEQLARKLLAASEREGAEASEIATEARGHPMFIHELVHHSEELDGLTGGLRLEDAIWTRANRLDGGARALLEAISVAGAPIAQSVAFRVAGVERDLAGPYVGALQSGGFARVSGARGDDAIETYHDRVREAVYASLSDTRRRELHLALGSVLEGEGAPAGALFQQFEAAGDTERADRYVVAAAEAAYATMAFGRAVELYRRALETERDPTRRCALLETLGDALSNDGRSSEAGEVFLEAARLQPDPIRELDLKRRAAERLLMSGHMHRGIDTAREVLGQLGMTMPETKTRTIASILWNQVRLRSHSLTWRRGDTAALERIKTELFWSLGCGFSLVDILLGAYFGTRCPLLAFKQGDPMQIARALCAASLGAAVMDRSAQAERLLAATERAAREDGGPLSRYYAEHARMTMRFVRDNDWLGCLDSVRVARPLWREAGRGPGWETDFTTHFECASYQMLGEYGELTRRVDAAVREAQRTGNLFLEVSLRVRFAARHLVRGEWQDALADVDDALAAWLPESDSFGNQRAWALWSKTRAALCSGELEQLVPQLDEEWRTMRRSLVARVPLMRLEWYPTYGSYLCGKAQLARRRGRASEHARLLRAARHYAEILSRMRHPAASQSEWLLRAAIAWAGGDAARAVSDTRRALAEQRAHPTLVFEWSLQRRLGELIGGSEGDELIADARHGAAVRGITDLDTFARIALPGVEIPPQV